MGFGDTLSDDIGPFPRFLRNVTVPYINNTVCTRKDYYGNDVTDIMLCAGFELGGKDSCQGDSGGPIVKRTYTGDGSFVDTLVGVVSWGKGCAKKKKPGVYSRTSKRASWIKSTMCNELNSVALFCGNTPTPSPPPCEHRLFIRVSTDRSANENTMILRRNNGRAILTREYLINNYQNEHHICLESNTCYTFVLSDSNGSYELVLNEDRIRTGNGNSTFSESETFCTGTELLPLPCADGNVPFRLEITTDRYGRETSWSLVEEGGDEIDSVPFEAYPSSTTIEEPGPGSFYCLKSDACYDFVINDGFGDGMCCQDGEGSYSGYLEGTKLFEGREFGSSERQNFCIGRTKSPSTQPSSSPTVSCTDGVPFRLEILTDEFPDETSWRLREEGGDEIGSGSFEEYAPSTTIQGPGPKSSYCLKSDTCYVFVIEDEAGDGMCCGYGEGYYSGYLEGEQIFGGGKFKSSDKRKFCTTGRSTTSASPSDSPSDGPSDSPSASPSSVPSSIPSTISPTNANPYPTSTAPSQAAVAKSVKKRKVQKNKKSKKSSLPS